MKNGKGVVRMKKLSEINKDNYILMYSADMNTYTVITPDEIDYFIKEYKDDELKFYTAIESVAKTSVKEVLEVLTERYEDSQYDDWSEFMYNDMKDLPEVKAFVEAFNKAAEANESYLEGEQILIDE